MASDRPSHQPEKSPLVPTQPEYQNPSQTALPLPPPPSSLACGIQNLQIGGPYIGNPHFNYQLSGYGSLSFSSSGQQHLDTQPRSQIPLLPLQPPLRYHIPPPLPGSSSCLPLPPPPPQTGVPPPHYYSSKDFQFNPPQSSQHSQPLSSPTPPPSQPSIPPQVPSATGANRHLNQRPSLNQDHRPPLPSSGKTVNETEQAERLRKGREDEKKKEHEEFMHQLRESQKKEQERARKVSSGTKGPRTSSRSQKTERSDPLLRGNMLENRLKELSSFQCKMTFRNELPDPSAKIKILPTRKNRLDEICKYKPNNSLEKLWKPEMYIEPDLGIPLDLLDISAFNPPKGVKIPLDPEDEALWTSDDEEEKGEAGDSITGGGSANPITTMEIDGLKRKERPSEDAFPWLVKTEYISPLSLDSGKKSFQKQARELQKTQQERLLIKKEKNIQTMLSTFDASKYEPVHRTQPEVEQTRVWTLLPDDDRLDDEIVDVDFDEPPTAAVSEFYRNLREDDCAKLESKAIMKHYMASSSRSDSDQLGKHLAYMVPSVDDLGKDTYKENETVSFTRIREYQYEGWTEEDPKTYLVTFRETEAQFRPLPTKLILKKKMGGKKGDGSSCLIPKTVTVRNKGRKGCRLKKNARDQDDIGYPKELEDDIQ